jgi:TRAP-type C4-dicarboxylate transport system permease small subunit
VSAARRTLPVTSPVTRLGRAVASALDGLYTAAGGIAAAFLVGILVIIMAQILARLFGIALPGATDYAGYCMAAASFFAFAHTFKRGAHIRVSLLLQHLTGRRQRALEIAALVVAGGLAWYFAWYAVRAVKISRMIHDVSQGQDATPLWIPQLAMAAGTVLFAVAITDHLVRVLLGADPRLEGESVEG